MSLELYHKLMQDEDIEAEEVVCEEGEECPVEEEAAVEEANTGSILAAILHLTVQLLNVSLPLVFFFLDAGRFPGGLSTLFSVFSEFTLYLVVPAFSHGLWNLVTFVLGTLVFFMDIVDLWDSLVNGIGFWISAILALLNAALLFMYLFRMQQLTTVWSTELIIRLASYVVGQAGYLIVVLLLSEDAKAWFLNNLGITEGCGEAEECVEPEECEDPEAEDCTYDADLALYEACTAFNAAREECLAAQAAAEEGADEDAEGDVEEEEEEAFFF